MFNSAALEILRGPSVPVVMLVEMGFEQTLRLCSASVDLQWGGYTWLRTGNLGSVDAVKDSGGDITGLKFSLSGVPSDSIALALGETARGKSCAVYLAVLDPQTHAIADVGTLWRGQLDQMQLSEGGASGVLSVTALHLAAIFRRPKPLRYTDDDQRRLYPDDFGLEFIVSQSQHQDVWPAAAFFRN